MPNSICFFEIPAADTQAAKLFYGALFGWSMENIPDKSENFCLIQTERPTAFQGGAIVRRSSAKDAPKIYVQVDSIALTLQKVNELGGRVLVDKTELPTYGWTAIAADVEGNAFGLFEVA